ncbi:MAG: hypothetical protein ACPLZE_04035 [Candidatus Bipolaricaulaceae bacterium]
MRFFRIFRVVGWVVLLIWRISFFALGLGIRYRRAVRIFRRGLRRAGLPPAAVEELSRAYAEGLSPWSFLHGNSTGNAPWLHRFQGE